MTQAMYVHVPFCDHICAYCDFTRCGYYEPLADRWLNAIKDELQHKTLSPCTSVYIGGGTPSALSVAQLTALLEVLQPYVGAESEYTTEANGESLSREKITLLKQYGVNRISLGLQSFQPHHLQRMGRKCDGTMIRQRIAELRSYHIDNISLDLMYGLPDQTMAEWVEDLQQAMALPITHLSLYALTIEPNSRFGKAKLPPCDPDLEADFYETAIALLEANGFHQYEVSNFARDDHVSRHNLAYWHYDDFYGIGCGASGKENHMRYDNTRNLHTYIESGPNPQKILLTPADEQFEMMMMGLRLKEGVSDIVFKQRFACSYHDVFSAAIEKHIQRGNLQEQDHRLSTTKQGMMLLQEILVDFL